jgi:hypothetical protein
MKSVLTKLNNFIHFSPHDRSLLLQALVLLPLIHGALRLFGFKRAIATLNRVSTRESNALDGAQRQAWRTSQLVRSAARRGLVSGNCLSRSLTLWWLLRHQGITSELRIGVRKEPGQFLAHAWVEFMGHPLNERGDVRQQYTAFEKQILPEAVRWA